MLGSKMNCY